MEKLPSQAKNTKIESNTFRWANWPIDGLGTEKKKNEKNENEKAQKDNSQWAGKWTREKSWQRAIDWRADNFDVVINSVIGKHNDTQAHCQEDISIISSAVVSVVVFFVLQPLQNSTSTATPLPQDYNFSNHISREMKKERRRASSKWLRGGQ